MEAADAAAAAARVAGPPPQRAPRPRPPRPSSSDPLLALPFFVYYSPLRSHARARPGSDLRLGVEDRRSGVRSAHSRRTHRLFRARAACVSAEVRREEKKVEKAIREAAKRNDMASAKVR
jgi:hypothetical protein